MSHLGYPSHFFSIPILNLMTQPHREEIVVTFLDGLTTLNLTPLWCVTTLLPL